MEKHKKKNHGSFTWGSEKQLQDESNPEAELILLFFDLNRVPIIAVIYRLRALTHVLFPDTGRNPVVIKKLSHK